MEENWAKPPHILWIISNSVYTKSDLYREICNRFVEILVSSSWMFCFLHSMTKSTNFSTNLLATPSLTDISLQRQYSLQNKGHL